jgi:hypothetical protein
LATLAHDASPSEKEDALAFLKGKQPIGREYEPHCVLHDSLCVVSESSVSSLALGGECSQSLLMTYINNQRILNCPDRLGDLPEGKMPEATYLVKFVKVV